MNINKLLMLISFSVLLPSCVGYVSYTENTVKKQKTGRFWVGDTKKQTLAKRGEPDDYGSFSNQNIWIYKDYRGDSSWCGVVPFLIIPIPLILPLCNEGEVTIEFTNEVITTLEVTEDKTDSYLCGPFIYMFSSVGGNSPQARSWCSP